MEDTTALIQAVLDVKFASAMKVVLDNSKEAKLEMIKIIMATLDDEEKFEVLFDTIRNPNILHNKHKKLVDFEPRDRQFIHTHTCDNDKNLFHQCLYCSNNLCSRCYMPALCIKCERFYKNHCGVCDKSLKGEGGYLCDACGDIKCNVCNIDSGRWFYCNVCSKKEHGCARKDDPTPYVCANCKHLYH